MITALVMEYTGRSGSARGATLPAILDMLRDAVGYPGMTCRQKMTLSDILWLLEGRRAGAEWRLSGAHEPGRHNPAGEQTRGGRCRPERAGAAQCCQAMRLCIISERLNQTSGIS